MLMRKCRWLRLALLVPIISFAPMQFAWSLGLSEIEVESSLNEKFQATIELMDVGDLSEDEILVSLASREDFERVGVERFFYLTDLKFSVDVKGGGTVHVTSSQTISEPYLNFIVEIRWPKGRLLKEFTVLLDPPTFSTTQAPAVSAPAAPSSRTTQPARATTGDRVTLTTPQRSTPRPTRRIEAGEGEVVSTTDDTLWKIAQRTLPSDRVSVNQQMLALQKLNPNAFIRNNINLLKAGYALRVPTEQEALALDEARAVAEVREQEQAWRNPDQQAIASRPAPDRASDTPSRSQLDATPAGGTSEETGAGSEQGQVRIVANSGELAQGSALEGAEVPAQLLEERETLARQVDELSYQLDREKELAASQIELKERQLEVKDQALAQLQERVAQLEEDLNANSQQQTQDATQPAAELPWWQSPMLLGGIIGVLVLLLAWMMFALRRNREDEEIQDYGHIEVNEDDDADEAYGDDLREPSMSAAAAEVDDQEDEDTSAADDDDFLIDEDEDAVDEADDDHDHAPESGGDVIAEADIYIAYGRYGQAASLLLSTLSSEPDRHDVRLKLLETCVEGEDPEQFAEHAEYLVANCDDEDVLLAVRELEARMSDQVSDLDAIATDTDAGDDDLELDVDAIGLDDEAEAGVEATADDASEDDFELEFDGDEAATDDNETISDDLGGDLGMDFDPDREEDDAEMEFELDIEDDLDLDDDLSLDDSAEPQVATDDEFDLDALDLESSSDEAPADDSPADDDAAGLNDFDFGADGDSDVNTTKLDLAEAYVDMGDGDGARDILREVLEDGTPEQVAKAQALLDSLK